MHIGIDASRVIAASTGTERYSYELLAALARHDHRNDYWLYCNGIPAVLPPLAPNFRLVNLPARRLWTYTRLGVAVRVQPPAVLFVPSHTLPVPTPRNSVVTIHDLGYRVFPAAHTRLRRIELHLTTLWSARAARRVIAISHATRHDLITHYRIAPEKITVIHHGVSAAFAPVHDERALVAVRDRYAIGAAPYLLYVGTVQPRKNLARLIDAFALARAHTGSPVRLVLAGKRGWLTAAIEHRAAARGLGDAVHFAGYVADGDLPALLSGARAFVFPSLYEGFGMPVLEAMACGTPVLTSTTSSLPEVAGDAALLVDPHDTAAIADGLTRLLTDDRLHATLRERGRAHAARFTWAATAQATLGVLSYS